MAGILTKEEIINGASPLSKICFPGVYYLVDKTKKEIVFIGRSKNVLLEIAKHISQGKKKFDSFYYIIPNQEDCDDLSLCKIELGEIRRHKPRHNVSRGIHE